VSGAQLRALRQGPHNHGCNGGESLATCGRLQRWRVAGNVWKVATVASRWQRVEDLISSGFEFHTSRTRSERLTTCAIWTVCKS